jgi:hypothetical protein
MNVRGSAVRRVMVFVLPWLWLTAGAAPDSSTHSLGGGVDPDAGADRVTPASGEWLPLTAQGGEDCEFIGDFTEPFTGINRFRANWYRMTEDGTLDSFYMQLEFTGDRALYFYVYGAPSGQNTFTRLWEGQRQVNGTGRTFYHSGAILVGDPPEDPLLLTTGMDYIIGVAWGSPAVIYGRSVGSPPPFSKGLVRGATGITATPPLPIEVTYTDPFATAAYSMQLCFAPDPGACCLPGNVCDEILEEDCGNAGGRFAGEGVGCGEIQCPLPTGSCCIQGMACQDARTEYECVEAGGGDWQPGGRCADEPCGPRGACCLDAGECLDYTSRDYCENVLEGVYRGDDLRCVDLDPQCGEGACCTGSGCFDGIAERECEDSPVFGTWRGDGSSCATINPRCPGGCCVNGDSCQETGWTPDQCTRFRGLFLGYGVDCQDEPDPCEVAVDTPCCLGPPSFACVTASSREVCEVDLHGEVVDSCDDCRPMECQDNEDCDDGQFCSGAEVCVDQVCESGGDPCPGQLCDEQGERCVDCFIDADCDDFLFCTGAETCVGGACVAGSDPCKPNETCDEENNVCVSGCVRSPDWVCDGDVDGNGTVNPVDVGLIQSGFCAVGQCDAQDLCQYDMDCNDTINPVDVGIVQSLFGVCDPPREVCP